MARMVGYMKRDQRKTIKAQRHGNEGMKTKGLIIHFISFIWFVTILDYN